MRYAQLVIGPAGSGKSTYCSAMVQHGIDVKRAIHVINLDPAAEHFNYQPVVDIRELIHVQDTMEDEILHFGPNGGLIFSIEYLVENAEWLKDRLGDFENDYLLFDCPGQIELYTHLTAMKNFAWLLQSWNFKVCTVYLVDAQFMTDSLKYISATMSALSVMINLDLPHLNIMSKLDLIDKSVKKQIDKYMEPDFSALLMDMQGTAFNDKHLKLTESIARLIEDYSLVRFLSLNLKNQESVTNILLTIDDVLQFGEDQDVKTQDFCPEDPEAYE